MDANLTISILEVGAVGYEATRVGILAQVVD